MKFSSSVFGQTKEGQTITKYCMENKHGMRVEVIDYGACIVSIFVPDREGKLEDVVLGFDDIAGYEVNGANHGGFIGRHGNRIGNAKFTINGITYELEKNDGNHNLHGGFKGYHKMKYDAEVKEDLDAGSVEFSRISPDMEQGFPGNLELSVTYTLTDENELVIEYFAVSDKDTVVNLTNHSYFNLAGQASGSILDHNVWIKANAFTATDDDLIPTGELTDVTNTPMDFRVKKKVGQDIHANYRPLEIAGGYDHNYVLDITGDTVEKVAELTEDRTGRKMEVFTNMPGMQFYTGNFLDGSEIGKGGKAYNKREGLCFETQYFPNACNIKSFPSSILKAGVEYEHVTTYKFSVEEA